MSASMIFVQRATLKMKDSKTNSCYVYRLQWSWVGACPYWRGVPIIISEGVVLCTGFNGVELGPEDVSPIREVSSIRSKLKCPDYGGVLISEGVVLCTGFNAGQ